MENLGLKKVDISYPRLIGALIVGFYFLYCIKNPTFGHMIDYVDLVIHEAGHTIFSFFGQFIHVLAGSFVQVLVPTVFAYYFLRRMEYFSFAILSMFVEALIK